MTLARVTLCLLVVAVLTPVHMAIGGVRLTPYLVVAALVLPFLLLRWVAAGPRMRAPDVFIVALLLWQGLTIGRLHPERVAEFAGQQTLFTLCAYAAGRVLVRSADDFAALLKLLLTCALISLPFALYEATADVPLILHMIARTPFTTFAENDYAARLGLHRAQWVFSHPIHYGLFCAFLLSPVLFGLGWVRPARGAAAAALSVGCLLSVSSGAVLSVALQIVLALCHRGAALVGQPWRIVIATGALFYLAIEIVSTRSAFTAVSTRLAIDTQTAEFRTLIWRFGSEQVARTPLFGNGYRPWARPVWMTDSVDNHWLQQAMQHGLPATSLLIAALVTALWHVNRASAPDEGMRFGWTLFVAGFAFSASTVAIWGEIQVIFMLLFGAGLWMAPEPALATRSPWRFTRTLPERSVLAPA
ncbi:O-antigen ligase family protein [Palleronia sp.]|uniref:O-antigen ligase family protein n=1 Tax=Palleronia sp. TaxID=1940284 RepID=UPI0035C86AAB